MSIAQEVRIAALEKALSEAAKQLEGLADRVEVLEKKRETLTLKGKKRGG
jgi:hypothetical protein